MDKPTRPSLISAATPDEAVEAVKTAVALAEEQRANSDQGFADDRVLVGSMRVSLRRFPDLVEILASTELSGWVEASEAWRSSAAS